MEGHYTGLLLENNSEINTEIWQWTIELPNYMQRSLLYSQQLTDVPQAEFYQSTVCCFVCCHHTMFLIRKNQTQRLQ